MKFSIATVACFVLGVATALPEADLGERGEAHPPSCYTYKYKGSCKAHGCQWYDKSECVKDYAPGNGKNCETANRAENKKNLCDKHPHCKFIEKGECKPKKSHY
ncbi:hypothetical protein FOXG_14703 [Fusarium oxysporum f. sp. lycopersici 4287]|uniref:Antifungal protein n=2 Tax=Fusarium oxysporum TaxID=5507 RepID=A0A0J9WTM1_FUSO4|nr:hypothetical protein FOXG_14703 [Fusarium oxysporum f. sp. lycopersici 4287]KAJ9414963.1 hypothetical protein QL093DRAFT_2088044 [Fusarium oxysporum]KNB16272.1 hypothetical protein FOXG_14703 [Fusarium oxysporum f. sp. lycopersici 4287]